MEVQAVGVAYSEYRASRAHLHAVALMDGNDVN